MMFIHNKYYIWYLAICQHENVRTRRKNPEIYYERHHIVPKSMGGKNSIDNLVFLTFREHYICHWLLTKCVEDSHKKKMIYALWCMSRSTNGSSRIVTSWQYEISRKYHREAAQLSKHKNKNNPMFGKQHSDIARAKMKETNALLGNGKGSKNSQFGVKYSWYTNGEVNKKIREGVDVPLGFYPGRKPYTDAAIKNFAATKGTRSRNSSGQFIPGN